MPPINRKMVRYIPLDEATKEPDSGTWDVYVNRWWSHTPEKGIMFYRKSPQCNSNEQIARKIQESCYPEAETIFVPRVYLRHNCRDYD
jgi:hypothetical protein